MVLTYYFCNLVCLNDKNLFHFSIYRFASFFLEAEHHTGCARHNLLSLSPIYGHVVFPVCCYYNKQCHNEQSQINNFADVGQHFGRQIPRSGISGLSSVNIYLNKYGHSSFKKKIVSVPVGYIICSICFPLPSQHSNIFKFFFLPVYCVKYFMCIY